jgi:hypothetical protein
MVELNRLMNYVFDMSCMPPSASGAKSQNTLTFIYEKNTWSIRSRSRSFTCSTFPLTSPMISTRGSHGLSGISSFGAEVWPSFSLGMLALVG